MAVNSAVHPKSGSPCTQALKMQRASPEAVSLSYTGVFWSQWQRSQRKRAAGKDALFGFSGISCQKTKVFWKVVLKAEGKNGLASPFWLGLSFPCQAAEKCGFFLAEMWKMNGSQSTAFYHAVHQLGYTRHCNKEIPATEELGRQIRNVKKGET